MYSSSPINEPMMCGSPTTSPKSPDNASFVAPSFLLGGNRRNTPAHQSSQYSPQKKSYMQDDSHQQSFSSPFSTQQQQQAYKGVTWSPELVREIPISKQTPTGPSQFHTSVNAKRNVNAPPLRSLSTEQSFSAAKNASIADSSRFDMSTDFAPVNDSRQFDSSSLFRPPTEESGDCWVTVFGFPPDGAAYVLRIFARYGAILAHEVAPKGNWMHIRYQSTLSARQALSKNGTVFDNTLQLGVSPCTDKAIMQRFTNTSFVEQQQSANERYNAETTVSIATSPPPRLNDTSMLNHSRLDASSARSGMRPLAAAYRAVDSSYQLTGSGTPTKAEHSMLSRLWGYVGGN
uniref:Nucleoporin NUP53 n=1 Tax=Plectus sambesii TaxID=2011161 RepID=A0A914XEQ7_9BILA